MTTPAVNIDSYLDIQGSRRACNYGTNVCTSWVNSVAPYRYKKEVRPASTNSPKDSDGWRKPTNFSHVGQSWILSPIALTVDSKTAGLRYEYADNYGWSRAQVGIPAQPSFLLASAVNKALLKLKSEDVNFGVAFLERKETGDLAVDFAKRTVTALRNLGKAHKLPWKAVRQLTARDLRSASQKRNAATRNALWNRVNPNRNPLSQRNTKKVLNDFLQVQYGVRPLMQDIHGSLSAIEKSNSGGRAYHCTVKGTTMENTSYFSNAVRFNNVAWHHASVQVRHLCQVKLWYVLDNPILATLSSLGLTNPVSWLWERVPFSFVIDWALKVGDYISAFDATLGWNFMQGYNMKMTRVKAVSEYPVGADANVRFTGYGVFQENNYSFTRQLYTSSPWPRVPHLKNPLSSEHTANAIALAASRLR